MTNGTDVDLCPGANEFGWGFASETPQFTLNLAGMDGYALVVDVDSICDPTLLLHDAFGQWHFNDDTDGLQPQLQVNGASLNGRVSIWVGSYGGEECQGTITFETISAPAFNGNGTLPQNGGNTGPALCPNPDLAAGNTINITGADLQTAITYQTTAGGAADLWNCSEGGNFADGFFGAGFASETPSFTFNLSTMEQYNRLSIRGVDGCDTTLLAHTPDGQWHFNDDGNIDLLPLLELTAGAQLNGQLDVWVGTYGDSSCAATIELRGE